MMLLVDIFAMVAIPFAINSALAPPPWRPAISRKISYEAQGMKTVFWLMVAVMVVGWAAGF